MSKDDEPPRIVNTSSNVTYIEESGPVSIFDAGVGIVDADNQLDHQRIQEVRVMLDSPVVGMGEDQLIANGTIYYANVTFSCNATANFDCYRDFLMTLMYNNTLQENNIMDRRVIVEVH